MVWVLDATYGYSKSEIIAALEKLANNNVIHLQRKLTFNKALQQYKDSTANFADCLILAESILEGSAPLLTFDKKLGKLTHTKLLA